MHAVVTDFTVMVSVIEQRAYRISGPRQWEKSEWSWRAPAIRGECVRLRCFVNVRFDDAMFLLRMADKAKC